MSERELDAEFKRLTKPLIALIYAYFDPDYDIITINGHEAFVNHVNDNMIEIMNQIGFYTKTSLINNTDLKKSKKNI